MLIVRLISALVSNPLQRYYEEIGVCKFFLKKNVKKMHFIFIIERKVVPLHSKKIDKLEHKIDKPQHQIQNSL